MSPTRRRLLALTALLLLLPVALEAREATPQLEYVEKLTGGAGPADRLPVIIAIHGLGDRPEAFVSVLSELAIPARVIVPRAPTPYGPGGSWFPTPRMGASKAAIVKGVKESIDRLAALVKDLRKRKTTDPDAIIVTGFSQGGILAWSLAVTHPDLFLAAFPVGGFLPKALWPEAKKATKARRPPIVALHGAIDRVVGLDKDRAGVEVVTGAGWTARLESYQRVAHRIPGVMRQDLHRFIAGALARK